MNNISLSEPIRASTDQARNSEIIAPPPPPPSRSLEREPRRRRGHPRAERATDGLLYRYGFAAFAQGTPPPADRLLTRFGWSRRAIGPVELWAHPEATVRVVPAGGAWFAFIGDVIPETGPEAGDPFAAERLAAVAAGDETALLAFIDGFAGRFALLFVEPTRTRVLHDPIGARSVFYHAKPPFAVASHAELLARCVGAEPDLAVLALLKTPGFRFRKTKSMPGDLTHARDIYGLTPNNLFDSAISGTRRYWPRAPRRARSVAAFRARLDTSIAAIGRYAAGRDTLVLGATAGADSRLLMAGLTKGGHPFETVTLRFDKLPPTDQNIIANLVARLDAPHVKAPVRRDRDTLAIIRRNSGFRGSVVPLDARGVYGGRPETLFVRGHGAEIIRGFFNLWPTRMTATTPAEMARLFFSPRGEQPPAGLVEMFEGYFRRANYAGLDKWGYDSNDIYYWEHRMGMWSAGVSNEFDVAMRSVPGFNSRPLLETGLGLPARQRLTKRLLLDAAALFDPRLRGLPVDKMVEAREARRKAPKRQPVTPPRAVTTAQPGGSGGAAWLTQTLRKLWRDALTVLGPRRSSP